MILEDFTLTYEQQRLRRLEEENAELHRRIVHLEDDLERVRGERDSAESKLMRMGVA